MKVRVFTLRWDDEARAFDDEPLARFLDGRTALEVTEHFLVHERTPVLVLVVRYRDDSTEPRSRHTVQRQSSAPDPAADLAPEERTRFEALRQWRAATARRTGKPPYLLLTNKQAVALAQRPPTTKAALREIAGIGDARVEELGDEVLALLAALPPSPAPSPPPPPTPPKAP